MNDTPHPFGDGTPEPFERAQSAVGEVVGCYAAYSGPNSASSSPTQDAWTS